MSDGTSYKVDAMLQVNVLCKLVNCGPTVFSHLLNVETDRKACPLAVSTNQPSYLIYIQLHKTADCQSHHALRLQAIMEVVEC